MFECERRRKMQKKIWLVIALLLVIPGLLFTVGCQKKTVTQAKAPAPAPAAAAPAAKKPAPAPAAVKPAETSGMIMQEDIFFEFDKSTLTPAAQDNLMRKAAWLRDHPDVTVTIEGHCDERGTNEYNLALGDRRAGSPRHRFIAFNDDQLRRRTAALYAAYRGMLGQKSAGPLCDKLA